MPLDDKFLAQLEEFLNAFADRKFCEEDEARCSLDSGPYCGHHDAFICDQDILKARELLEALRSCSKA